MLEFRVGWFFNCYIQAVQQSKLLKQVLNHPRLLFSELLQVLPEKRSKPGFFFSFLFCTSSLLTFFLMCFQAVLEYFYFCSSVHSSSQFVWWVDHGRLLRWECGDTGIVSSNGFVLDEQIKALRVS